MAIALDMRELNTSLCDILPQESEARRRFSGILQVCASISVVEDFLEVQLGIPEKVEIDRIPPRFQRHPEGEMAGIGDFRDDWNNSATLPEYARLQAQLDAYKIQLRREIARFRNDSND
jgi:hypothetical protein